MKSITSSHRSTTYNTTYNTEKCVCGGKNVKTPRGINSEGHNGTTISLLLTARGLESMSKVSGWA
jgi:hypothetical protein